MKGVDIFCASQASTAICLSMEQNSTASPSTTLLLGGGGRVIDRHNPIIKDSKRTTKPLPPTAPKNTKKNSRIEKENQPTKSDASTAAVKRSWSCTKPGDFLSPPGSTRYLLRADPTNFSLQVEESSNKEDLITTTPPHSPQQQVVVELRVSLHCRGCVKKLRKHLSRMEGVESFDIDFLAKKVTVAGNVSPSDVLSSISKVKNAQLWPPSISSSNPTSEIKSHDHNYIATA